MQDSREYEDHMLRQPNLSEMFNESSELVYFAKPDSSVSMQFQSIVAAPNRDESKTGSNLSSSDELRHLWHHEQ